MKKSLILMLVLLALVLCACGAPCEVHEFAEWEVQQASTCSVPGLQTRKCLNCKVTEEEEIPTLEHSFGEMATVQEPTCSVPGVKARVCAVCSLSEEEEISTTKHSYGEWTITREATCEEKGSHTRSCTLCSEEQTAEIVATGHAYGEKEEIVAADCLNGGQTKQVCATCGYENIQDVQALGHDFSPLYCKRCDETKYELSEMHTFYDAADGLAIKANSFTVSKKAGYNMYRLNWTIKGVTENSEITHGQIRLYLADGTWEYMYGMFPYVYYKESYTFYYDWKMLKDKTVIFAEYVPFSENGKSPMEGAPRWAAP